MVDTMNPFLIIVGLIFISIGCCWFYFGLTFKQRQEIVYEVETATTPYKYLRVYNGKMQGSMGRIYWVDVK